MYPTLFTVPFLNLPISTFGVMMAIGFLVAGWMAARAFPGEGLASEEAWRLLTWAMVGGVVGSKLWFVGEVLARHPEQRDLLFSFDGPLLSRGGITWYGGLVGGAIGVLVAARVSGLSLIPVMNATAPAIAIGQALGRVGCFLVGDDWGARTDGPFGIAFPDGVDPTPLPVHPTQLYEVAWLSAACFVLWRRRTRSPSLFGEYLMIAGAGRLWIELFRINPPFVGPLTNAQVTAVVCMALGAALWLQQRAARARRVTPAAD